MLSQLNLEKQELTIQRKRGKGLGKGDSKIKVREVGKKCSVYISVLLEYKIAEMKLEYIRAGSWKPLSAMFR